MSKKTHAEIIAEMRNRARRPDFVSQDVLKSCADELDAAHKREIEATAAKCCQLGRLAGYGASEIKHQQEPVGDAAKLREALVQVQECANGALMAISHENVPIQHMWDIIDVCKAALSITNQDTQED